MDSTFDGEFKMDDSLEHHGTKGMHWGVWNDETKRKYGVLGPKRQQSSSPETAEPSKPKKNLAQKGVELVKQKRQEKVNKQLEAKRAEEEAAAAEEAKKARDAEVQAKYGLSAEKYEKLRNAALNSNDPTVVAKGMKFLTDDELNAKIDRLERESKIKSMAASQRTSEANAKKAELERKKQTLPYRLGEAAAKNIVNQVTGAALNKGVMPVVNAMSESAAKTGLKAVESIKKNAAAQKPAIDQAAKQAKQAVSDAKETPKPSSKSKPKKEKGKKTTAADRVREATGESIVAAMRSMKTDSTQRNQMTELPKSTVEKSGVKPDLSEKSPKSKEKRE